MGANCTKEFSAVLNKASSGLNNPHANNSTKYRKTELTGSAGNNATVAGGNSQVKESQVKFAIIHPQIKDILARLSYEEIQILLVRFYCFTGFSSHLMSFFLFHSFFVCFLSLYRIFFV
jgi:hypothetical protein